MALTGIQIYKLLPQTNCKECGFPTCLAFAMKLGAKQVELSDCPYVTEEATAQLAESAAPPIRLIELVGGGHHIRVGNETVLFRHEKTFYNRPGLLISVRDTLDEAAVEQLAKTVDAYGVDYVGVDLRVDGLAVEATSGDATRFAEAVRAVRRVSDLPLVLVGEDPAVLGAGVELLKGEKPLLMGANAGNWDAMSELALQSGAALGATAGSLEELAELTDKLRSKGVEDIVLQPAAARMGSKLAVQTQIRRLALKNFRPLGYPTIEFVGGSVDGRQQAVLATQAISKYAGLVVLDEFSPELLYPLLVLRENIYTDPQKPIQVQPALYEINNPTPQDPVLVTTNFSITYFSVANEVEGSGIPAWLLVTDAEGMSVLTAWAAGKFDAESIAKSVRQFDVAARVERHDIVLPGHVAVLSGELEEELPDWNVLVGPREAVDLPAFMKTVLSEGSTLH
ncbi:MAG TPA: acetyl-CoA decarbonylase/synthase complex subunit gamma [Acidimicrobiia bacterium]|nr:acetyl-CoA decarbonylase/synthase complex subunit gamma [Acidimicrobiia bacterium]